MFKQHGGSFTARIHANTGAGVIGGNMVRRMVMMAEQQLAGMY
jgi:hypothetical protein